MKLQMAAILDFNVKNWSNRSETIETEFPDPKKPQRHILINPVAQNIPKLIFQDGGWRPFWILAPKKVSPHF